MSLGTVQDVEERRRMVLRALKATRGNVADAAKTFGITRAVLWYHLRRLGMDHLPGVIQERRRKFFKLPETTAA